MSEQERENKELIKEGYAAFSAGDIESVLGLFDDNIEWVQPGDTAISGTYHGKAEVLDYIGRLAAKSVTVTLKGVVAEGDTVVALTDVTVGNEHGQNADVFTLRDGKAVRVQVHTDTAIMERVYGRKNHAIAG